MGANAPACAVLQYARNACIGNLEFTNQCAPVRVTGERSRQKCVALAAQQGDDKDAVKDPYGIWSVAPARHDRHRERRHAESLSIRAPQVNLPHMPMRFDLNRACHRGDVTAVDWNGTHVVGRDRLANALKLRLIDSEVRCHAAECFSECNRDAAVKDPEWLLQIRFQPHSPCQEIGADLRELDADVRISDRSNSGTSRRHR
jgi:hypothetical protein